AVTVGVQGGAVAWAVATRRTRRSGAAGQAVLVTACAAAVLLSSGAQLGARAPVDDLADAQATATVTATVRSAAVARTNPWSGAADRYEVAGAPHEITARGATRRASGPVVVTGPGDGWADLAYGATVVVTGRFAHQGDRTVLRTDGPPRVVAQPGALLRGTHAMRQGLLGATDGLSPQARGLVPGVAVGDTSRLDPALDAAMRTTSLTHVTAVSGGHFAIVVACVAALCVLVRAPRAARGVVTGAAMAGFVVAVRPWPRVAGSGGARGPRGSPSPGPRWPGARCSSTRRPACCAPRRWAPSASSGSPSGGPRARSRPSVWASWCSSSSTRGSPARTGSSSPSRRLRASRSSPRRSPVASRRGAGGRRPTSSRCPWRRRPRARPSSCCST